MAGGKSSGVDLGLLVVRLALGGILIAHGVQKLTTPDGLKGLSDSVAQLGLPEAIPPYPLAVAAVASALAGGLLVALGLLPRLGALSIAGVLAVVILKVHLNNGFFNPRTAGAAGSIPWGLEYDLALLAMALGILFAGGGTISLYKGKSGGGAGKTGA